MLAAVSVVTPVNFAITTAAAAPGPSTSQDSVEVAEFKGTDRSLLSRGSR